MEDIAAAIEASGEREIRFKRTRKQKQEEKRKWKKIIMKKSLRKLKPRMGWKLAQVLRYSPSLLFP